MACRCAPALIALRTEVDARWPGRDKTSDGCCGDAAHAARTSDHNPDAQGWAHAYDIDEDIAPATDLLGLWDAWRAMPDPRIKYLIYEAQIVYPNSATDRRPRAYTGPNAHRHHMHVSIVAPATHDVSPWLARLFPQPATAPPTPTPEADTVIVRYLNADTGERGDVVLPGNVLHVVDHRAHGVVWAVAESGAMLALGRAEAADVDAVDGPGFAGLAPHLAAAGVTVSSVDGAPVDGFHINAPGVPGYTVPADHPLPVASPPPDPRSAGDHEAFLEVQRIVSARLS